MAAAALLCGEAAVAQSSTTTEQTADAVDPALQDILKSMQSELEKLRNDNQTMRTEIDDLRAKENSNWLTEERSEQIKSLVSDVLADADTRASLQDGLMAGWSDHFFLASADGRFKLQFEGLMQFRFIWNHQDLTLVGDKYRYGFENARTYLTFSGHVFTPDLQFLVRGDFSRSALGNNGSTVAGTEGLLDAWVRYNMTDHWSVRAGQFKLPFMREELVYDGYMQAVEHTLINFQNSAGRSQGIELTYGASYNRLSGVFSDGSSSSMGGLNPNRANTPWNIEDTEWAVTARYEHLFAGSWSQFTDFTSPVGDEFGMLFGLAFQGQESDAGTTASSEQLYGYTADLSVEFGGANVYVAWVHNYMDARALSTSLNSYGLVVQAGFYLSQKWEVFGQFQWGRFDVNSDTINLEDLVLPSIGVNYYIEGQDVKWTSDIGYGVNQVAGVFVAGADLAGWRADPNDVNGQIVIRTQLQLLW
jgi:hypothetical protein